MHNCAVSKYFFFRFFSSNCSSNVSRICLQKLKCNGLNLCYAFIKAMKVSLLLFFCFKNIAFTVLLFSQADTLICCIRFDFYCTFNGGCCTL